MYKISKRFSFSASHQIAGLPSGHPCARLHGHNYEVEVVLEGASLNEIGFLRDYRELSAFKRLLDDQFDHRHLNDVLGHDRTTSEVLAHWFYEWCKSRWAEVAAVRVSETPKTWAEFRPLRG
ncbi:MAG: 6-carboxytetrahydropterin synthase QueD [Kiloniellales bacterium]|nr:6-carboxytetrahydropterin synthase QueD [Kiloniellales bacterium]